MSNTLIYNIIRLLVEDPFNQKHYPTVNSLMQGGTVQFSNWQDSQVKWSAVQYTRAYISENTLENVV